ncbi:MAG: DUF4167 domain-containing protein [Sphingomonadaceae bacterium]|nr:DUF4167 domain-containing protein [Sphingomonadaceae bacterium]NBU79410.1 DUF4167 domain-containing protein [Sphingomonadaceae bacterium]NCA01964.1 DUF4167 domain-containing protein [Sphingomonadaceae bacterium]
MLNNRQSNRRRGRGRGSPGNGGRQDNGSRIDNRARGNAPQLLEKYKNLAREAQLQGDRVLTEYYLQFADHYFRIVAENRARFEENRQPRRDEWQADDGFDGDLADEGQADASSSGEEESREQREPRRDRRPQRDRRDHRMPREAMDNGPQDEATTIDVAILPPALGVSADPIPDLDGEPAPVRRRGRPRRTSADEAEAEAAE